MDRDRLLGLVRVLTKEVIATASPEKLADFADAFGDFTLQAGTSKVSERLVYQGAPGSGLDTTLVAGMFFEVLMDASRLPAERRERVSFVRKRAKDYLVNRLAGQITLSQFYRLLNLIEAQVGHYFEHLTDDWTAPPRGREAAAASPGSEVIDSEALRQALSRLSLPLEGKRKLTFETVWDFLRRSGGCWFRLLDFEEHFRINKKTAWGYLNLLQKEGVLEHNGEKANRVRYALAPAFRAESEKMRPC
ncbi:MAG: hypothetical protein WBW55_10055 [Desulfobaccales bacterium]